MFRKHSRLAILAVITALTTLLVISCGGGGGGDSPPARVLQPISYTGVITPVAISLVNTPTLVANVLYGGASATVMPSAVTITETSQLPDNSSIRADRLMDLFQSSLDDIFGNATQGYVIPAGTVYNNEIRYCESGHYIVNGTVNDITVTGTLTFDYYNCLDDGVTLDGIVHFTVHQNDYYQFNFTMDFVLMTVTSSAWDVTMSGTVQSDNSYSGYAITARDTMNYVERANRTGKMYSYESFVMTVVDYDYSGGSISYSGTPAAIMYDSDHGSYSVETPTALEYSSDNLSHPDLGGQLVLTGDQSGIQMTVESARHVKLEIDLDGAAGYEVVRYVLWSELDNVAMLDLSDTTDNDGMHTSWEISIGLDPNVDDADEDPDLDGLTNLEEYEQGYDPSNPFSPTT